MKRFSHLVCIALLLTLVGCAAKQLPPPQWTYEKEAVGLHIQADKQLNLDEGVPHTLLLCVYQLSDPNTFNQLSNDQDGLYTLLECSLFSGGAVAAKRLILQPGKMTALTLDRAEGARYVAIVAGYTILDKDRMIKLVDIPEYVEKKGWIKRTKTRKPASFRIDLTLGPRQIKTITTTIPEGK